MEKLAKEDYGVARRCYGHTRRFIDDLCTLNNKNYIANNWKEIYPNELILNKENKDSNAATFLDLDIRIEQKMFVTKIYDKRDAFPFEIVSLPDLRGNIAEAPAYGVFKGQLIRYARNCTNVMDFVDRTKYTMTKLLNKDYDQGMLNRALKKCLSCHSWISAKYDLQREELLAKLI